MKAWIVDDERPSAEITEVLLLAQARKWERVEIFTDPEKALDAYEKEAPDLVFLDIEMPRLNGLEWLSKLPGQLPAVIFTTAYDQFAIQAFRLGAVDYLVKPVDEEELESAVERALERRQAEDSQALRELVEEIRSQQRPSRLPVSDLNGIEWIDHSDIVRCESDSNYTTIVTASGRKLMATKTLKQIEALLPHPQFYRVHHSHLVNTMAVVSYQKGTGGTLVMSNGDHVPVSRQNKAELMKIMGVK